MAEVYKNVWYEKLCPIFVWYSTVLWEWNGAQLDNKMDKKVHKKPKKSQVDRMILNGPKWILKVSKYGLKSAPKGFKMVSLIFFILYPIKTFPTFSNQFKNH